MPLLSPKWHLGFIAVPLRSCLSPQVLLLALLLRMYEAYEAVRLALQDKCFPQTIAVCKTRASGLGLTVKVSDEASFEYGDDVCGVMVQYPATDGRVLDYSVSYTAMQESQCILPAAAECWASWIDGRSTDTKLLVHSRR